MRTLEWIPETNELCLIDQRWLPGKLDYFNCSDYLTVAWAIREMVVRGAPAIGAAAAFGLALAAFASRNLPASDQKRIIQEAAKTLAASRPTAVNLTWAIHRMLEKTDNLLKSGFDLADGLLNEAQRISDEDVETNRRIAGHGADLINDEDTIIHHCNTGSLATVEWGTALGVIRLAHEQGKRIHVLVDETRPRLQGARLTAWELERLGISYEIICDGASGFFLSRGQVMKVFFGADRVAANGDVANKVGSYMLALAAHANHVPVYSVFPTTTVDLGIASGDLIPIEERDPGEVLNLEISGQRVTPAGAKARNPAFDVTPGHLLSGLITEKGIIYPPFEINLPRIMRDMIE